MEVKHVEGTNRGKVMLYALSTCVWCKKTKGLLDDLGVDYSYIYVDQLAEDDTEKVINDVKVWNPACTFPTVVINDDKCIVGFKAQEIKKELGYE